MNRILEEIVVLLGVSVLGALVLGAAIETPGYVLQKWEAYRINRQCVVDGYPAEACQDGMYGKYGTPR